MLLKYYEFSIECIHECLKVVHTLPTQSQMNAQMPEIKGIYDRQPIGDVSHVEPKLNYFEHINVL